MKYLYLILLSLSGCATYTINTPKDFTSYDDENLCLAAKWVYATHNDDGIIAPYLRETVKRNLMNESQFKLVHQQLAGVGDNKCFMFATRGKPYTRNRTQLENSTHYQFVYRHWSGYFTYVYTENDKITAIQD